MNELSSRALDFLVRCNFKEKTLEEKMKMIIFAKLLYPSNEDEDWDAE